MITDKITNKEKKNLNENLVVVARIFSLMYILLKKKKNLIPIL